MRNFLILICILIPYCCLAQFFDDFSDPSITKKNNWQGDLSVFIQSTDALRLINKNPASTGLNQSYVSAPFSMPGEEICWEFSLELLFNPTASNYAAVYLIADKPDLTASLNGYFIRVGGKDDELVLYRQSGVQITSLLTVPQRLTAKNSNEITIRVIRTRNGWQLFSLLNSETKLRSEGSVAEPADFNSTKGYLGFRCTYTSTYATKFYFYEIGVSTCDNQPDGPDDSDNPGNPGDTIYINQGTLLKEENEPLRIDSVQSLSEKQILLHFNHPVNISKAHILVNPISHTLKLAPTQYPHIVYGMMNPALVHGDTYTLLWANIYSLAGKLYEESLCWFTYSDAPSSPQEPDPPVTPTDPEEPETDSPSDTPHAFGDIVFAEIMANPKGITSLPEVEYIELLNRTTRRLSLKGCRFFYNDKKYELPQMELDAKSRVILCHSSKSSLFRPDIPILAIPSFPILANVGKLIYLESPDGKLLHWIEYSDKWYADTKKKEGGYALEMIDPDFLYSSPRNWGACQAAAGGTPGKANSIEKENPDEEPVYLISHSLTAAQNLSFHFSKPIEKEALSDRIQSEVGDDFTLLSADYPRNTRYQVTLSEQLSPEDLSIRLDNLSCIDGVPLLNCGTLLFGDPDTLSSGSIGINELLVQPHPGSAPFIEIRNQSDKLFDLSDLFLTVLDADSLPITLYPVTAEATLCEPHSYVLISTDPLSVFDQYGYEGVPRIIAIPKLPPLPPSQGNLALTDRSGKIIESVYYHNSFHDSSLPSLTGVSLERRTLNQSALIRQNWTSGNRTTRFATPGYTNYADPELAENNRTEISEGDHFRLRHNKLRLNPDSPESELVLLYQFDRKGVRLNTTLYTATGLKVARLAVDCELELSGELIWKNEWRNRYSESPGIYVLLVEYASPEGINGKEKLAIPIIP